MDDITQKVFLKVELDTSDLVQNSADAKQVLDSLKAKQKELTDSGQQGTIAFANIAAQVREASKAYADANKQLDNTVKQNNSANGSLTEMKANLSLLTKQYNDLSAAERNNESIGGQLQKQIKDTSDALKGQESAIGDNYRNVGNYAGALTDLKAQLKDLKGQLVNFDAGSKEYAAAASKAGEITDKLKEISENTKALAGGSNFEKFGNQIGLLRNDLTNLDFKGLKEKMEVLSTISKQTTFKESIGGLKDLGSSIVSFGKVLLTNPLFLLVAVLAGIAIAFYKLKDSIKPIGDLFNAVSDSIKGLQDLFFSLTDAIGLSNEALKKSVEDNLASLNKLYEAEKKIGEERLLLQKAYGDNSKKVLAENLAEEIKTANLKIQQYQRLSKAGEKLTDEQKKQYTQDVENFHQAQIQIEVLFIESQTAIRTATKAANDKALEDLQTSETAKVNLKKQKDLEAANVLKQNAIDTGTSIAYATELYNKEVAAINSQYSKEISDAKVKDAKDAQAKIDKINADANALLLQRLKGRTTIEKILLADSVKGSQEEFEQQIAVLRAEADESLAVANLTANDKLLIELNFTEAVKQLGITRTKNAADEAAKQLQDAQKLVTDKDLEAKNQLAKETNDEFRMLTDKYENGEITYGKYLSNLNKLTQAHNQRDVALKVQELRQLAALEKTNSEKQKQLLNQADEEELKGKKQLVDDEIEEEKKKQQMQEQVVTGTLSATANLFGALAGMYQQGSDEYKAFAKAQAIASAAAGAIGAFAQAASTYPAPYGVILGAIEAAVVVAEGITQVDKINNAERGGIMNFPKAEHGMIIGGEPHSRGGTKFVGSDGTRFEAEKDELLAVVNKRNVAKIGKLNALNMANGNGNNFFGGGGISYLADGGFANRSLTLPVENQANHSNDIKNILLNLPPSIVRVEDINSAQSKRARVKSKSEM